MPISLTVGTQDVIRFIFGNASDTGLVREHNEDYYGYFSTQLGEVFVVCDGMGGHNGGEVASRLAVESVNKSFSANTATSPEELLRTSIELANTVIWQTASENKDLFGMGTTIVLLFFPKGYGRTAFVAHVGDSRVYLIRNRLISRLTMDHSKVMSLVKLGLITLKEAASHPEKNIITRALGIGPSVKVEVNEVKLTKGDRYVLCTDGISDLLSDEEILSLSKKNDAQNLAEQLIKKANNRGGLDNSTVQVIDIESDSTGTLKASPFKKIASSFSGIKLSKKVFVTASSIILILVVMFLVNDRVLADDPLESQATDTETHDSPEYASGSDENHTPLETAELGITPPEQWDSIREEISFSVTTQPGNRLQCEVLEINEILSDGNYTGTLLIDEFISGEEIALSPTFQVSGENVEPYSEVCDWRFTLPEVSCINIETEVDHSRTPIYCVIGKTDPGTSIQIGNEPPQPVSADGSFSIPLMNIDGNSVSVTLEHPLGRTAETTIPSPERFVSIGSREYQDIYNDQQWLFGENTDTDYLAAESFLNQHTADSWRFPTVEQLSSLPDDFLEKEWGGSGYSRAWTGSDSEHSANAFPFGGNEEIRIGFNIKAGSRVILVRSIQTAD